MARREKNEFIDMTTISTPLNEHTSFRSSAKYTSPCTCKCVWSGGTECSESSPCTSTCITTCLLL